MLIATSCATSNSPRKSAYETREGKDKLSYYNDLYNGGNRYNMKYRADKDVRFKKVKKKAKVVKKYNKPSKSTTVAPR